MRKIKITRTRSGISQVEKNKTTLKHLGLNKINDTVILDDNAMVRGMIRRVEHMVKVEDVTE